MRRIILGFLALTLFSVITTVIGLKIAGYNNISVKQRIVVNGKFQPFGLITPVQIEGTKTGIVKDSITTTQSYVWGENFSTIAMENGEDARMAKWSDSIQKQLGARTAETKYFWGKSKLAERAHGNNLKELLKGKTFTKVAVIGYASPEAGTPGSLMPDSIDEKNVLLAQNRAAYTLETVKNLFRLSGKNIDTIETTIEGKELQLDVATAQALATPNGFAAVRASNRSGKDTLGYSAHTALSKLRFTELKVNFTEDKKTTMVVTQPLLILFLLLFPLWQLLSMLFNRKYSAPGFKWPKCGCKWTSPSFSWPRCNCKCTWPTFTGCTFTAGSWKCCLCNKALRRLWRMRFKRIFKNILATLLFILWILLLIALAIAAAMYLIWYYAVIAIAMLILLLIFLTSYIVDFIFWLIDWLKEKSKCRCFWWKLLSAALGITVLVLWWILAHKPC